MDFTRGLTEMVMSDWTDEQLVALFQIDLARIEDERLQLLLDRYCRVAALQELMTRYYTVFRHLVRCWTRTAGLWDADAHDEEQNVVFAVHRAATEYDPRRCARPPAGSFRRFLYPILHNRFRNECRRRRREERHYDRSAPVAGLSNGQVVGTGRCRTAGGPVADPARDPALTAERGEWLAEVMRVLGRLPEADYRFLEFLAAGRSLRAIARKLGVSYAKAKRTKGRLKAELWAELKELPS
jgi:RNA polymerase sigma factor (sigma-70 family)